MTEENTEIELTLPQKSFVDYYLNGDDDFRMGNATRSYAKAFNYDITDDKKANTCASEGSKLIRYPNIKVYMRQHLEDNGWNDEAMDSRLRQIAYKGKDADAVNAIKEFNKLKQRIIDKFEHEGNIGITQILVPPKKAEGEQ